MVSNDIILPVSPAHFGVGSVISISFKTLFANIGRLLAIIFISALPVIAIGTVALTLFGWQYLDLEAVPAEPSLSSSQILVLCLLAVSVLLAYPVAIGAISYGTFRYLAGTTIRIGESLKVAWRALPQMLGVVLVMVLIYLGLGLVVALLTGALAAAGAIVGGIVALVAIVALNIRWWPAFAVVVVERPGVVAGLARSAVLTADRRGSIFGVAIVIFLISLGVNLVTAVLGLIPIIGLVINFSASLLLSIFMIIAPAVGYYLLRIEKEGIGIDEIVKVFD
jgi:hypothetical protein